MFGSVAVEDFVRIAVVDFVVVQVELALVIVAKI